MKIRRLTVNYLFISVVAMTIALFPATGVSGKQVFDLVSLNNEGTVPSVNYGGNHSKVTPDGRFVVFRSSQPEFHPANIPLDKPQITSGYQIFLRDRKMGTIELISINNFGEYGNNESDWATISDDGCRVAFRSYSSNLVTDDNNGVQDIFLRDRCASQGATTTRINLNYLGSESNGAGDTPYLSGDGKFVVFNAYGNDLVQGVTDRFLLYLRDLDLQQTTLVSESVVHPGKGEAAYNPSITSVDDNTGTPRLRIAFSSASKELVTTVQPDGWNVFLYDTKPSPHFKLVSADVNGTPQLYTGQISANGDMPHPGISANGHYVSFYSNATNLVANDTNGFYDIFVKNVDTDAIWRANVSNNGAQANADTQFNSTLSQDGTWVTFWALASNLTSTPNISRLVVLHNIFTGETRRILGVDPEDYPSISGDLYGRFISNFWGDQTLDPRFNNRGIFLYDRHNLPVATTKIDSSTTQPVQQGDTVTLDGSSSNNNANITNHFFEPQPVPDLVYTWTQTEGNSITFDNPHAAKPTFIVPADGTYTFKLVVNDTVEDSLPDTLSIQVGTNQKPIANAGPDQTSVIIGDNVVLDGSQSSDPDNGPSQLSYSWSQIAGLSLNITGGNTATPSFTPAVSGSYSFRLVVNDGKDSSTPDVVTIVVGDAIANNIPPVAVAGDNQSVIKNSLVTLDGGQSYDPDSNIGLSFQWTQIAGPVVKLNKLVPSSPSFTPKKIGSYSFQLIVKDGKPAASLPSVVTITVSEVNTGNQRPLAVPQVVTDPLLIGSVVKLSGVASNDPDPKLNPKKLQYQWNQSDGPAKIKLANPKTVTPSFTPKLPGFYVFDLAVFDGVDWSMPESVTVYVNSSLMVTSPAATDVWNLGTSQNVSFETVGINPKTTMRSVLALYNATKQKWDFHILPNKFKATDTGSFTIKIPNKLSWKTDFGLIFICANDQFCSYSDIFSIQ